MTITYNGSRFFFRKCDVRGMTQEEVQQKAESTGQMQYEPSHAWLIIPGIGYGMRDEGI